MHDTVLSFSFYCNKGSGRGGRLTFVGAPDEEFNQAADLLHLLLPVGLSDGRDVGFARHQELGLFLMVLLQEPVGDDVRSVRVTDAWRPPHFSRVISIAPEHGVPCELGASSRGSGGGRGVQFPHRLGIPEKPPETIDFLLRGIKQRGSN